MLKLYTQTQEIATRYRVQNVRELRDLKKSHPFLPENPEEVFGDLWPGASKFFAPSCMTVQELFEFMKERRVYDVFILHHIRRREPHLRIPRSLHTFYSTADYDWLRKELQKLREERRVLRVSHSKIQRDIVYTASKHRISP